MDARPGSDFLSAPRAMCYARSRGGLRITAVNTPETRYAKSGDVRIAYQVTGQGPVDLVFVPGFISNLEAHWEEPGYAHLLTRLSSFSRLIHFDKRGTGLSDHVDPRRLPSLETRMEDVHAVMDAAGSGRAVVFGASEGAPMAILFAATYPERTRALVIYGGYAHFHGSVMGPEALERFIAEAERDWGTGASLPAFAPGRADDAHFAAWWGRFERLSASPTAAIALARMNALIDIRGIVGSVHVPTLVIHRAQDTRVDPAAGRFLAEHIPDARLIELPGRDHALWAGPIDPVVDAIEEFVTGVRPPAATNRVLGALHSARLVNAARLHTMLGDWRWVEHIDRFHAAATEIARRLDGQVFSRDTDHMTARFDGAARAAHAAIALRERAETLGLDVAQSLHVGELDIGDGFVTGLAAHTVERIAGRAGAGDILASRLVAELSVGSGLHFTQGPELLIEGFDYPLGLLRLATEQHLEPMPRRRTPGELASLSAREREVLALVADGMSNRAIAGRLRLSQHTVKRHVANILTKLDLRSRAAAAAHAARQPDA